MSEASVLRDPCGSPLYCVNPTRGGKRRRDTDWRSACGSWSFSKVWNGPCTKEFHDALHGRGDVSFEIGGHPCPVSGHSHVLGAQCLALSAQFSSPLAVGRHVVRFDSWVSLETLKGFLELVYLGDPCEGCRQVDARELWVICDLLLAPRLLERLTLEVDRDNFAVAMATAVHLGYSETNVKLLFSCVEHLCLGNAFWKQGRVKKRVNSPFRTRPKNACDDSLRGVNWPVDFCDALQRVVREMLGVSELSRFSRAEDVVIFLCKVQVDCGEDWTLALRELLRSVPLRHVSAATLEKGVRCALLFRHERDEALTSQCYQVHSPCSSIQFNTRHMCQGGVCVGAPQVLSKCLKDGLVVALHVGRGLSWVDTKSASIGEDIDMDPGSPERFRAFDAILMPDGGVEIYLCSMESTPPEIAVVGKDGKRLRSIPFDPVFKASDVACVGGSELWITVPGAKRIMVLHSGSGALCRTIPTSFEPSKVIANQQGCVLVTSNDHRAYFYHAMSGWHDLCLHPVMCACTGAWGEFYVCTKSEVLIFSPYGVPLKPSYPLSKFSALTYPSWMCVMGEGRFSLKLCHLENPPMFLTYVVDVTG